MVLEHQKKQKQIALILSEENAQLLFVSTGGKNKKMIAEYIRNQLKEDMISDQMTIKEYIDPFKG